MAQFFDMVWLTPFYPPGKCGGHSVKNLYKTLLTYHHCLGCRHRSVTEVMLLKSVIKHVQFLASWCGQKSALLNSRCFTLRPLPSFPGRRAARSNRVTGTREREELEGGRERGRARQKKLSKRRAPTNHFVTSKLWQAGGERKSTSRDSELNRGANRESCWWSLEGRRCEETVEENNEAILLDGQREDRRETRLKSSSQNSIS